jgi:protein-S-isoprenylcysteine O-methyltransferase Ste14
MMTVSLSPSSRQHHIDLMMRLPLVACFGMQSIEQAAALAREAVNRDWLVIGVPATVEFLARANVALFMVGIVIATALRSRRIGAASGLYPRLVALLGTFILLSATALPRPSLVPGIHLAASLFMLSGYGLSLLALLRLGRCFSIMPEARRLVTHGVYALVRHPLYAAEEIAVIGMFLDYASPAALLLFGLHGALQLERMRIEERVLTAAFPEYQNYAALTARLIPGLY